MNANACGMTTLKPQYVIRSSEITTTSGAAIFEDTPDVNPIRQENFNEIIKNSVFKIKQSGNISIVYITLYEDKQINTKHDSKDEIWKELFDTPYPVFEENVLSKYAGSLAIGNGMSNDEILESLDNYDSFRP